MKRWNRHIDRWLGSMLMLAGLVACASGPTEEPIWNEKPVLKLYLFAPSNPIITRADVGYVDADEDENRIKTLDAWVFKQGTSDLVSYIHLNGLTFDASTGQKEITMDISKEFVEELPRPQVDIFVAANAAAYCDKTLNKDTSPDDLKATLIADNGISGDFFGLTNLTNMVASGAVFPVDGLPMSGFEKNVNVTGSAPVLSAKSKTVKLERTVSKVRFIFSKSDSNPPAISELSISLDAEMLPKQEYLFLNYENTSAKFHINADGGYNDAATTLIEGIGIDDIDGCDDPASYVFRNSSETEDGQAYETRINNGLMKKNDLDQDDPDLSEIGRFYFRESDKQLKGTINYKVNNVLKETPVEFSMASAGDFTRNHTWIVYGYFLGSGELQLNVVCVKDWTPDDDDAKIHNW